MRVVSLVSAFMCCIPLVGWADRVPVSEASAIASRLIGQSLRSETSLEVVDSVVGTKTTTAYLFRGETSFALLAADDRLFPVIGWSDNETLDLKDLPPQLGSMLSSLSAHLDTIEGGSRNAGWDRTFLKAEAESKVITTPRWGQWDPYNLKTPLIDGEHAPVGCLPLSMGIVMSKARYAKAPTEGCSSYKNLPVSQEPFDWERIPEGIPSTEEEKVAVAEFLWNIGANCKATYEAKATGATTDMAFSALSKVYGYSSGMRWLTKGALSDARWKEMMRDEIDEDRPFIYLSSQQGGIRHAYVCDGYRSDGAFHFNWGWNGNGNGYYYFEDMTPCEVKALDMDHEMIIGIEPEGTTREPVYQLSHRALATDYATGDRLFSVSFAFYNIGSSAFTGSVALGRMMDGEESVDIVSTIQAVENLSMRKAEYSDSFVVSLNEPLADGEMVIPVFQVKGERAWQPMDRSMVAPAGIDKNGLCYEEGYLNGYPSKIYLIENPTKDFFLSTNLPYEEAGGFGFQLPVSLMEYQEGDKLRFSLSEYDEWKDAFELYWSVSPDNPSKERLLFDEKGVADLVLPRPEGEVASVFLYPYSTKSGHLVYKLSPMNEGGREYGSYWTMSFYDQPRFFFQYASASLVTRTPGTLQACINLAEKQWVDNYFSLNGCLEGLRAGDAELFVEEDGIQEEIQLYETSEGLVFRNVGAGTMGSRQYVRFTLNGQRPFQSKLSVSIGGVGSRWVKDSPTAEIDLSVTGMDYTAIEGVQEIERIRKEGHSIVVTDCRDKMVEVYTADGRAIFKASPEDDDLRIPLGRGLYIVRMGGLIKKIVI